MYKVYLHDWIIGCIKLTTSEDNGWDLGKPELNLNKFTGKYVYIKFNEIYVSAPSKEIERMVNQLQNKILISAIRKYFPNIPKEFDRIKSFQYTFCEDSKSCRGILIDCFSDNL